MNNSDTKVAKVEDIWVALGLLTRLPLPEREWSATRSAAKAAWAYPLVGLVVGLFAGFIGLLSIKIGWPTGMTAALILLSMTLLTGAMHEDGLADSADGLWGGTTVERRLEIMKDSHIGAYGVIALISGFALRWSAISALLTAGWLWMPILVSAVASRAAMTGIMEALPNARTSGLSSLTGRPGKPATFLAIAIAVGATLLGFGVSGVWVLFAAAAGWLMCDAIARGKIGGQTGDILGATQQVTEILVLGTICAMVL